MLDASITPLEGTGGAGRKAEVVMVHRNRIDLVIPSS